MGIIRRYALSIFGPVSVSAAHFLASLIFLRELPPVYFGQFAFLLIIVPFLSVSAGGSLTIAPLAAMVADTEKSERNLSLLLKVNLLFSVFALFATTVTLLLSNSSLSIALILAPYGALMSLRWFGRAYVFARSEPFKVMLSDLVYSLSLCAGILVLFDFNAFNIDTVALVMTLSALLGTFFLGADYLRRQFWSLGRSSLRDYWPVWQDYTRWSLVGVTLAELTANAHAYLVTFISGPKAFAVLAVGALLMRPVSLVMGALPDFERPRMARALAAGDYEQAFKFVNQFRTAGAAIWAVTLGLLAVLLIWFPHEILKGNYDHTEVIVVLGIWAVIMAARVLRTPESVLLQGGGEFKPLAAVNTKSSVVSVIATATLLFLFGPLAALGGILIGELMMTGATISLFRKWKASHV
jgi:O-antigen/teichoic acid export membrane protein